MSDKFPAIISWTGSTAEPGYSRTARLSKPGSDAAIPASSAVHNGGDPACWNPEDLLAGALANCMMLTFLALAHKVRLNVVGYQGPAEAEMVTEERISRVARITLRPVITVADGGSHEKAVEMLHKSHKYCVIANSFNGEVVLEPTVVDA